MDTEKTCSRIVYQEICQIAKDLSSKHLTMTVDELGHLIEAKFSGYSHPYQTRGLLYAAYRYADIYAEKEVVRKAILKVFVNNDGSPIWKAG